MSSKKVLQIVKVVATTLVLSLLLSSGLYVALDETFSRIQRASLRKHCYNVLSERVAMSLMGDTSSIPAEVESQILLQCRQAIP